MLIVAKGKDTERQERDADEEQAPVEGDHDGDATDEEEKVGEERQQGVGTYTLDFANIIVDAGHDVAEFAFGEKTRGKLLEMRVDRETHVEQALGGETDVEIAGADVERKTGDGYADHQRGDGPEGAKIVANESVVNQEAGDVRLRETHSGGEQPQGGDDGEPSPIRGNERKRTPILSKRNVCAARRHGSPDSSRRRVARMPSGGILMDASISWRGSAREPHTRWRRRS